MNKQGGIDGILSKEVYMMRTRMTKSKIDKCMDMFAVVAVSFLLGLGPALCVLFMLPGL